MKIYSIETNSTLEKFKRYRFVSLFNSCKGTWCPTKEFAQKEGEKHQAIISYAFSFRVNNIKIEED